MLRSSPFRCSMKRGVLKNSVKFTGKHFYWSLIFNKVATACSFIKKETPVQVLSCEYCEIFKNIFFREHLRTELLLKAPLNIIFPTFPFVFVSLIISQKTAWKVSVIGVFLVRIESECGKIQTRKTPNTGTFHVEKALSNDYLRVALSCCFIFLFTVHQKKEFLKH